MRLGFEVFEEAVREAQPHRERPGLERRQRAVVEAAAVAQPVAARAVAHAGHEQQGRHDQLGVLGLGNAVGVFFHLAARVPGMEGERLVNFVDHRQSDAAALRFFHEFAVFLPAMQCGQRVELALDRPVGADHGVGPADQPDPHHPLQQVGPREAVGQRQTLLDECLSQLTLQKTRRGRGVGIL
ncbi:hypothetical protein D3C72_1274630 [compost metagenome]